MRADLLVKLAMGLEHAIRIRRARRDPSSGTWTSGLRCKKMREEADGGGFMVDVAAASADHFNDGLACVPASARVA